MKLFGSIKDHVLIGGPNAIAGWGMFVLLVVSGGFYAGYLKPGINIPYFLAVLAAAALTGNGVYAINAFYDRGADVINKPNRPIPSGRMTPEHARRYAWMLMALGIGMSAIAALLSSNFVLVPLWCAFNVLGLAYSIPPVKLKARHVWGNLCFGLFAVLTFFIGSILVSSRITIYTVITLFIYVFYIAGLITMKDFQDVEGDVHNGDISLPAKVGRIKAAALSIGLMAVTILLSNVFSMLINPYWRPPSSILEFIMQNWGFLIFVGSFAVYMVLDYVARDHVVSGAYSRVAYYYLIVVGAYSFLKRAFIPGNLLSLVGTYDRYIELAAYIVLATAAILQSRRTGHDILKPTMT